ncbi:DUF6230 family protein [Nocardia goodfellowii]
MHRNVLPRQFDAFRNHSARARAVLMRATREPPDQASPHSRLAFGHTRWRRFLLIFSTACLTLGLMAAGVVRGVLPVWADFRGQQQIKLSITQITGFGHGTFPEFFQTADGDSHPVLVAVLDDVEILGVCASSKVDVPFGSIVARIVSDADTPIRAQTLEMAIEEITVNDIAIGDLGLNTGAFTEGGTPREVRTGRLPIDGRNLRLTVHAKVRWITVEGLRGSGIRVSTGTTVQECF